MPLWKRMLGQSNFSMFLHQWSDLWVLAHKLHVMDPRLKEWCAKYSLDMLMYELSIYHSTKDSWRVGMIPVAVLRLLVLKDRSGMVEMGRNQLTLAGTWGLMAAEELLKELCHFTAAVFDERGQVVCRGLAPFQIEMVFIEKMPSSCYIGPCGSTLVDVVYVWKPKITYFGLQEENINTGHLGVKHQQSIRNLI